MMSRMEALEAKNSKLKKDLIVTIDEANTIKEKVKTLSDDLRVEWHLTLEKDEQFLVARCFWAFTYVCNSALTCLYSCLCLLCFFFVSSL